MIEVLLVLAIGFALGWVAHSANATPLDMDRIAAEIRAQFNTVSSGAQNDGTGTVGQNQR